MRILDVSPRVVYPPIRGSSVRTYNLLHQLSINHEVKQFSQTDEFAFRQSVIRRSLAPNYWEYRYAHPLTWVAVRAGRRPFLGAAPVLSGIALQVAQPSLLRRLLGWADVVLVEFPWQFDHCLLHKPGGPLVLASHNVETMKFASWGEAAGASSMSARKLRYIARLEERAATRAALVLTVSAADRARFIERYQLDPARVILIPNGADTCSHTQASRDSKRAAKRTLGLPDKPTVIFVGSDIPPNRRGLDWVERLARQTDRFTFLVVGAVAAEGTTGRSIVATGLVEDLKRYMDAADIAICPIEHGGGTKIKLLESLAAGLPTVAFAAALDGTDARDGVQVLVADSSEAGLLSALNRLADDLDLSSAMGRAARQLVRERYDWRAIAQQLERHLLLLVDRHGPRTGTGWCASG